MRFVALVMILALMTTGCGAIDKALRIGGILAEEGEQTTPNSGQGPAKGESEHTHE